MERKIFGGTNFIIVLWTLISVFRLVTKITTDPWETLASPDMYIYILPMLFLTVLNVFIGITLFFPQDKNKMWVISVFIAAITLVVLNTFQIRVEYLIGAQINQEIAPEF